MTPPLFRQFGGRDRRCCRRRGGHRSASHPTTVRSTSPTNQARPGARLAWTPRETEHTAFSMESRADLSKNAVLSSTRFSVLLFPHRDKEQFVTVVERGATHPHLRTFATGGSGRRGWKGGAGIAEVSLSIGSPQRARGMCIMQASARFGFVERALRVRPGETK